ncbi:MAG: VWA domain-containing protein [Deltaproteobacteria bacterium]
MNARALLRLVLGLWGALWALGTAWAEGSATLDAPASVPAGSDILVRWTGPQRRFDRIGAVKVGAPDSASASDFSAPVGSNPLAVLTPEEPGDYELRYFAREPNEILARRKFTVLPVTATVQGPASAAAGARISVSWTGPNNRYDRIGIVKVGTPDRSPAGDFSGPVTGNPPPQLVAPEEPGDYEIRYVTGKLHAALARAPLHVEGTSASVEGPGTAISGARISLNWTGPDNQGDRIGIVKAGTPDRSPAGDFSAPTAGNHPLQLVAPEAAGDYEIRYVTGQRHTTLARAPLIVTRAEATLKGPGAVAAGSYFKVDWRGPGNRYDHITVAPKGSREDQWKATSYLDAHGPATLHAPLEAGDYELRYQTGQTQATLARDSLQITPAKLEPGQIRVSAAQHGLTTGGAVEVILDASGSMLQRIGSERRIDIAKQTLKNLTSKVIPAGTPFALRVFGRQADSCQTDLEIPLRPLDAAAVGSKVDSLNAQSNAKTPIGASLEHVAKDLSSVKGERLVILVSDGEETCGGDPARAIEKLRKGGIGVRVNIVGFAVDDRKTAALFRQWSSAGGGGYFDARDAAGLNEAFSLAVRPAFEVVDARQKVVADGLTGGEPVSVLPGKYSVRLKGAAGRPQSVTVRPKQTTAVEL